MEQPIKYSDLISPDDSIEKLIAQLEQLNTAYSGMANSVKTQAQALANSMRTVSGATEAGRKATKDANDEAKRLEKAYKQLDAALSENAKEIAHLNEIKREANNYNKMIVQRGKEEIMTRKQIESASYKQLSAQYSLNKAYINSLTAVERNTAANRKYIQTTKEIYEQMKKLQADTGKMQLNVGNYPQFDMKGVLGSIVGVTSAAGAAITAVNALKNGVTVAKDYEHALSALSAILGTTKDNITELSEQARHLGATTAFTAQEVVQLQTELAKLGYTTKEITDMTPNVLSFAQATGSSLAEAASLTGAALRMFEKDTTHTQEFVDKMTAATTKSALSFSYLNNAMSTVGPVANSFGFKIEDVLALLGQLANAGFDASSAATATRNILLNLADSSGKLAQALGEPVKDLDGLINGLNKLKNEGIDLATALDLTDKRSVAAFNTFISGTDVVLDLRDALNMSNGAAADMAKTMGDDLAGDLKTLESAWQDLMITINNGQGLIRTAVQWLTKLVRSWKDYLSLPKSKDEILNELAARYDDGTEDEPTEDKPKGYTITKVTETRTTPTRPTRRTPLRSSGNAALREQEQQQKNAIALRRQYEDIMNELIDDEQVKERTKTLQYYQRQEEDLRAKMEKDKANEAQYTVMIENLHTVRDSKLAALVEKSAIKEQQEKERAVQQKLQESEKEINAEYQLRRNEIDLLDATEKEKTRMRLEAEKDRLQKLLALAESGGKKLTETEIKNIKAQIKKVDKEIEETTKDKDVYDFLGLNLNDKQKEAITTSFEFAIGQLSNYLDAWVQAADKKVELAEKEVDSAQRALDAEREARANGYASNVEYAQKELDNAKKNQQKALQEQARAQKAQQALDTAMQATSLITATANIWKALSGVPVIGPALAVAAVATMWGSFAAAKIKAAEVTRIGSEEYAEGTVELLQGGSHQSGNDVDLGRKKDGTRRRAEGGEYFAVINKRNSRKYRNVIPNVIHALNNGTFEQKYMDAYKGADGMMIAASPMTDISGLEKDVKGIREQGERQTYIDQRGTHIKYKNLHRIILN